MHIKRHSEDSVRKLSTMFGAVLVTGSRQIGKTTLTEEAEQGIKQVSLMIR